MARKPKGSRNRDKARRRVARTHARVADARRDFHHQLSTRLVRGHQTVCVETLNVAGMGRSKLAKSVYDAGWGQFTACGVGGRTGRPRQSTLKQEPPWPVPHERHHQESPP
jgi:transposase